MADNTAKQAQGAPLAQQGKPVSIEKTISFKSTIFSMSS